MTRHEIISHRAHMLWEAANRPQNREDTFWYEAERALANEGTIGSLEYLPFVIRLQSLSERRAVSPASSQNIKFVAPARYLREPQYSAELDSTMLAAPGLLVPEEVRHEAGSAALELVTLTAFLGNLGLLLSYLDERIETGQPIEHISPGVLFNFSLDVNSFKLRSAVEITDIRLDSPTSITALIFVGFLKFLTAVVPNGLVMSKSAVEIQNPIPFSQQFVADPLGNNIEKVQRKIADDDAYQMQTGSPVGNIKIKLNLNSLGFNVGPANKMMDDNTWAQLKRYGETRNLRVTGSSWEGTVYESLAQERAKRFEIPLE